MGDRALIELRRGPFRLTLCPALGGAITAFRRGGLDVMRPAGPAFQGTGEPRAASSFPLVPFSGRVADARFTFRGRTCRLSRNFPPEPHAIHGHGWQNPWRVGHANGEFAELDFAHEVRGTPLRYRARQTFRLVEDGLVARIGVTNAGTGPMPAGIGMHPYFVRTPGATLRTEVEHVWLADARNIPERRAPVPAEWDFTGAPRIASLRLDNGFGGWSGGATIHWPESGLTLAIEADPVFRHLVVYVPPGQDFFCVEPVSNANDGFNLFDRGVEGTGVRVLEPGESLEGEVRFRVTV